MKKEKNEKQQETQITPVQNVQVDIIPGSYQEKIEAAVKIASIISDIIEKKKLYEIINNKKYVKCEGWTCAGALVKLYPRIVEVKEIKDDNDYKCIATCELLYLPTAQTITRAEAEASKKQMEEKMQRKVSDFEVRSMAQTRATSKAFRLCLSWVLVLAGYEPTPAEEVDNLSLSKTIEQKVVEAPVVKQVKIQQDEKEENKSKRKITDKQRKLLFVRCKEAGVSEEALRKYLELELGITSTADLTVEQFESILKELEEIKKKKQK